VATYDENNIPYFVRAAIVEIRLLTFKQATFLTRQHHLPCGVGGS